MPPGMSKYFGTFFIDIIIILKFSFDKFTNAMNLLGTLTGGSLLNLVGSNRFLFKLFRS